MRSSNSSSDWTAALIEDNRLTLWTLKASQVVELRSFSRRAPDPELDLVDALTQLGAAQTNPVLADGLGPRPSVQIPSKPADLTPKSYDLEGWQIHALPGLGQQNPLALMQGRSAQIAGFLALNPKWDGVICLPGAVTHWVQVSAAEVVSFQSTLTTGLHDALASSLSLEQAWSESALVEAAADTMSHPERLASRLAEISAAVHFTGASPEATGRLWGCLLGAELAAARPYWLGQNLAMIATDQLAAPYLASFAAQGLPVTQAQPERMALEGLVQSWRQMNGATPDSKG
ncbi:2-dehydro-3-deoxygalactonokinase [Pseudophaeobacter sp.]|uniref:2-dehydro-3-deoxygalactonokinase n=1 Tax=Pseudophaeobacter sp. TaxID=1971739 RepID=UPI003297EA81